VSSQCLQNELALDKREPVTDQLFDAGAVHCSQSTRSCCVGRRTYGRLVCSAVVHSSAP
jgi:hypothetical protein